MQASVIIAERLRRQRLAEPLEDSSSYTEFFRRFQPVSPMAYSYPGNPPSLVHRCAFDDEDAADRLRGDRRLVKGRFQGGNVGYVLADELELYANAFRRPLTQLTEIQEDVLEVVRHMAPITPRQIREETGFLNKRIMPALHRLQEAFLVYEDQVDSDWDRGWYAFATEWPDIALSTEQSLMALAQVLRRFLESQVFATFEQLKDWSRLPVRTLKQALVTVEEQGWARLETVDGLGEGWIRPEDTALEASDIPPCVFMLHKADPLVRSHASELKRRFGQFETLQYLLIDGAFRGVVVGHWRIGPHDVDDIVVELPAADRQARRQEILDAVAWGYQPPRSEILRYAGESV